jgi:kumamolisin
MAKRTSSKHVVPGSERLPVPGAKKVGKVAPDETVAVTVRLRRAKKLNLSKMLARAAKPMSREQAAAQFGASAADAEVVKEFAREHGLTVGQVDLARRSITISGPAEAMQKAFSVKLTAYRTRDSVRYRQREGGVMVPPKVKGVIEGVFGLDDRPQARPHFRKRGGSGKFKSRASGGSFSPVRLASLYKFPKKANGSGQCIALVELGGGYDPTEMTKYFTGLGLKTQPIISAVSVDGAHNAPDGDPNGDDGEVVLDIQVAGAVAPGASIAVYFAPNTDRGFLDAVTTAIHDPKTTVLSISWGGPEESWTAQMRTAFDDAFQEAAALGIPVFVAAGDDGSSDGVSDGKNHVDFPASAPHAVACGGTQLSASGSSITGEQVWGPPTGGNGATGGGFSRYFARPAWQSGLVSGTKRGVPDVSADADPNTGYNILVDGQPSTFGGTSAVAPLWAGLAAVCSSKAKKRPSFILPSLYGAPTAFRDITSGSNGSFSAAAGWDACTGMGSPIGTKILTAIW